jgi:hypothetical protein
MFNWFMTQGRIQDFKLGGALKKIAPRGGRHKNCWGISCEKTILRQKIISFPILGGAGAPPGSAPVTPESLLIRLNDLIIRWLHNNNWSVCCLEFTFLEQSAQWSVLIVRMIMNENKLHVLLLSMNQRSKKLTRFCNGIHQNCMYCNG